MKHFIGIKEIDAKPMTRGKYNEYRGWTIPADENPKTIPLDIIEDNMMYGE